ncbi:MAG: hypothetical protein ACRDQ0_16625, partial [Pseudonocardia sp.]
MRRVHDWLVGRHEFRCLVEVDPAVGAAHGGRPIPGTGCAEFVQVGWGSRESARTEAGKALRERLAAVVPDATVLAILDGGPPAEPEPRLHLMKGGRPRLLLVGGEDEPEVQRLLHRVVGAWGLPEDRYSPRRVADRVYRQRRIRNVAVGAVFGTPLFVLLTYRINWTGSGSPSLERIIGGGDVRPLLAMLTLALLPGVAVVGRAALTRSWPSPQSWTVAVSALVPLACVVAVGGGFDAMGWLYRAVPAVGLVAMGVVALAAVPVLASYVAPPKWRAALGWGLPLVAGGIAPFIGELLYEVYLGGFGLARADVQISLWAQWLLGAFATVLGALGIYLGVALWAVFRRWGGDPWMGMLLAVLVAAVYLTTISEGVVMGVAQRAQLTADGVPGTLPGLRPRLACVVATGGPFSYVGQPIEPAAGPVVYF